LILQLTFKIQWRKYSNYNS